MTRPFASRSAKVLAQHRTAAPVARIAPPCTLARIADGHSKVETMNREPTAAVQWAAMEAKAALILAIEAVDDVLSEIKSYDPAIEHPELVAAFMAFAGHAYHAKATRYH
jgi:hypothetical protein